MAGMSVLCEICGGLGLVPTARGSKPCQCQVEAEQRVRLRKAGIPPEFQNCTLENFVSSQGTASGLWLARRYAEEFLPGKTSTGLMLTGTVGLGKTHLAVGIVTELVKSRGIVARFADIRILFERLRSSFDDKATETEQELLRPFFKADLVVLDELGAIRQTDWSMDTMEMFIGGLYNESKPVIITTNYPNFPPGTGDGYNARPLTLGDRIGARMWSRIQQMCAVIQMSGEDWRTKNGKKGLQAGSGRGSAPVADEGEAYSGRTEPEDGYPHKQYSPLRTGDGRHLPGDLQGDLFGAGGIAPEDAGENPET
jgi:DNA replication protein DnaC